MQCELLGVTTREQIPQLAEVLTGLTGYPGAKINQRDVLIKSHASPFTELHLVQHISDEQSTSTDSWEVCHEGLPVRGKGFAELPSVVRSRTTATCHGGHSLSFWMHLGFSISYELVKKGFKYTVCYDEFELQVLLCSVNPGASGQQRAQEHIKAVCQQYWLLKITAVAPESQQARAAHAIGAFSKQLEPWAELRKSPN